MEDTVCVSGQCGVRNTQPPTAINEMQQCQILDSTVKANPREQFLETLAMLVFQIHMYKHTRTHRESGHSSVWSVSVCYHFPSHSHTGVSLSVSAKLLR